jgi:hypothetical protein
MNATIRKTTYRGHEICLAEYRPNGADDSMKFYTQTNDVEGVFQTDTEEDGELRTYQNPDKAIADAKADIESIIDTAHASEVTDAMADALADTSARTRRNLLDEIRSFTGQANDPQHSPTDATMAALGRALAEAIYHAISNDSQWSNR